MEHFRYESSLIQIRQILSQFHQKLLLCIRKKKNTAQVHRKLYGVYGDVGLSDCW